MLGTCGTRRRKILITLRSCWSSSASFPSYVSESAVISRGDPGLFLHFHEDASDFYVDVKLDGKFQRMRVTSSNEQADFLAQVRGALSGRRRA